MKFFKISRPRLLPLTITALAGVLVLRSIDLVEAFTVAPAVAAEETPAKAPEAAPAPEGAAPPPGPQSLSQGQEVLKQQQNAANPDAQAAPAKAEPTISDSERALLQDLRSRKAELDEREKRVAEREAVFAAAEQKLSARVEELTSLQKRLEELDAERKQHDDANWSGMVKLYETMKPRDAAVIFNDLDMPILLPVLDRMKEQKAAAILAAMLPERARQATQALAQLRTKSITVPPAGGT